MNKNALSQVQTLIALRTTLALDRKAVADWVLQHNAGGELVESLAGLDDGEAWVVSPRWLVKHGQPPVQRIRFRRRETFDSGATPTLEDAGPPATVASIDLGALADRMAAVTEEAEQSDPDLLRRHITALRDQVQRLSADLEAAQATPPRIETVPVVLAADLKEARQLTGTMTGLAATLQEHADNIAAAVASATPATGQDSPDLELSLSRASRPVTAPRPRPAPSTVPRPAAARVAAPGPGVGPAADAPLKPGALRVLEALARRHPLRVTRPQMAALAGMKRTGGAFQSYFSALRSGGFIEEDGALISVTRAGLGAAGVDAAMEPVAARDLREMWRGILKPKAWAALECLLAVYPDTRTKAELAEAVGMTASGGAFQGYLTTLSTNDLVYVSGAGVRAADVFFLARAANDAWPDPAQAQPRLAASDGGHGLCHPRQAPWLPTVPASASRGTGTPRNPRQSAAARGASPSAGSSS